MKNGDRVKFGMCRMLSDYFGENPVAQPMTSFVHRIVRDDAPPYVTENLTRIQSVLDANPDSQARLDAIVSRFDQLAHTA